MKTKITTKLRIAILGIAMLGAGAVSAQQTTGNIAQQAETAPTSGASGSIRLIDNKGTIKYLQAANGITTLTNDGTGDVTTTTWQLGGELTTNTYIDASGDVFSLDGLKLVPGTSIAATAATDQTVGSNGTTLGSTGTASTDTGWTVLVRDEATGEIQKLLASSLVTAGQASLSAASTPALAAGANTVTGLPADFSKVSVYRNGAKLIANVDYTVALNTLTLVNQSAATPPGDWTLYPTIDTIEVQWIN